MKVAVIQHVRSAKEKPNINFEKSWFIRTVSILIVQTNQPLLNCLTMFYAIGWFVIFVMLVLWSLAAWALHAVAVWTVSNAGALSGAVSGAATVASDLALPEWLAPWAPPALVEAIPKLMIGLAPLINGLLQAAPALADGLTVAAWLGWGIGSALLVLLGVGLHMAIVIWQRRASDLRVQTI
jgi:hypothetical protein